jgi:hypothetical protein
MLALTSLCSQYLPSIHVHCQESNFHCRNSNILDVWMVFLPTLSSTFNHSNNSSSVNNTCNRLLSLLRTSCILHILLRTYSQLPQTPPSLDKSRMELHELLTRRLKTKQKVLWIVQHPGAACIFGQLEYLDSTAKILASSCAIS